MKKLIAVFYTFLLTVTFGVVGFCLYSFLSISELNVNLKQSNNILTNLNSQVEIFDTNNNQLSYTSTSGQTAVSLKDLPDYVKNAFIAIEDKNFYNHKGLNFKRIIMATFNNILSGYTKEGGSTISQQLIKNVHLTNDKTLKRKIQEAFLTSKLEEQYTKDEIMQTYLNVIYFGHSIIGVENAAQVYFNKKAKDLTIAQSAILAGIIKSPSYYSPITNHKACLERRNVVLSEMLKENYITENEYKSALKENLSVSNDFSFVNNNSFYEQTIKEAQDVLNLSEKDVALSNYKIYTYLDVDAQKILTNAVNSNLENINSEVDGVTVVVDNSSMGIIGLASTTSPNLKRQPGSLIKPILCYAPCFENGILSPISPILDEKVSYGTWTPENVDGKTEGWITTREALSKSKNTCAVKALEYVGLDNAKIYARKMGIEFTKEDNHLALALGAMRNGISPIKMAACYSSFANDGKFSDCKFIKKIEDKNGNIIYNNSLEKRKVFSEDTAYLISDVLKDTIKNGTAKKLGSLNVTLSAKTGTVGVKNNSENTDAWCASYNKNYTVCSWVGNTTGNSKKNLKKEINGGTVTANISKDIWQYLSKYENKWLEKPTTIKTADIDLTDLKEKHVVNLASDNAPDRYKISDVFSLKYLPKNTSKNFHKPTSPKLLVKNIDNELNFYWQINNQESYDIYENNKLLAKNISSPFSTPLKNGENSYHLVAKNKLSKQETKSNVISLFKETDKKENNIIKNIAKKWLFG